MTTRRLRLRVGELLQDGDRVGFVERITKAWNKDRGEICIRLSAAARDVPSKSPRHIIVDETDAYPQPRSAP